MDCSPSPTSGSATATPGPVLAASGWKSATTMGSAVSGGSGMLMLKAPSSAVVTASTSSSPAFAISNNPAAGSARGAPKSV
jgi:hypothetical protein